MESLYGTGYQVYRRGVHFAQQGLYCGMRWVGGKRAFRVWEGDEPTWPLWSAGLRTRRVESHYCRTGIHFYRSPELAREHL